MPNPSFLFFAPGLLCVVAQTPPPSLWRGYADRCCSSYAQGAPKPLRDTHQPFERIHFDLFKSHAGEYGLKAEKNHLVAVMAYLPSGTTNQYGSKRWRQKVVAHMSLTLSAGPHVLRSMQLIPYNRPSVRQCLACYLSAQNEGDVFARFSVLAATFGKKGTTVSGRRHERRTDAERSGESA